MINEMAWNTFKNTGSIDAFLELKQIEDMQKSKLSSLKVEANEYCKDEGDNNCRK